RYASSTPSSATTSPPATPSSSPTWRSLSSPSAHLSLLFSSAALASAFTAKLHHDVVSRHPEFLSDADISLLPSLLRPLSSPPPHLPPDPPPPPPSSLPSPTRRSLSYAEISLFSLRSSVSSLLLCRTHLRIPRLHRQAFFPLPALFSLRRISVLWRVSVPPVRFRWVSSCSSPGRVREV
ncbi:unnamed protein product, partial [Brassica oleracea var. botrytis]